MTIFKMPYAPMISVLVGFTALIPVFGAFIGTAIGAFLILMVSPIKALWFIIFIIVLQQVEGDLIYPKVVGSSGNLGNARRYCRRLGQRCARNACKCADFSSALLPYRPFGKRQT